ncbi:MAG: EMC3/TMCO1 family protein, partial [Candidatus Thorarchaeota archaeon]
MDLWSDFIGFFTGILGPVSQPPFSAVFILFVSVALALIASWATMRFSDVEQMKANMEEVSEWRKKLDVARKTMDPLLLQEVQDQQSRIMRLNTQMMGSRCKPMCIYYIPFIIIFGILNALYAGAPVAFLPFNVQKLLPFLD